MRLIAWLLAWLFATSIVGTASWGDFGGHIVTRYPAGTPVMVCGRSCVVGRSWGYGPTRATGRIVDLDRRLFEEVCGSTSLGLCRVTLRTP